jgi:site-specific recombinase XerD
MTLIGGKTGTKLPTPSETKHHLHAAPPADELALALEFARAEKSPSTRRAYRSDFEAFRKWCEARNLSALPATPSTLAAFIATEAKRGIKVSSLERRLCGIRYAHLLAGHSPPNQSEAVRATFRGVRRTIGSAAKRKEPITADRIRAMVKHIPNNVFGLRDRALLLLGFGGAFRRSELVALDVSDFKETLAGLQVHIRRSKTDQEQSGQVIAIPQGSADCPIKALKAWLTASGITRGPIFRSISKAGRVSDRRLTDRMVAEIVKLYASKIGLDSKSVSAHSLRAGFLTSAAQRGASIFKLMEISRHKNVDTLRLHPKRFTL